MPNKKLIEEYPLYRKFKIPNLPATFDKLPEVQVNMQCPTCASKQTFLLANKYSENARYANAAVSGEVFRMVYICAHCGKFLRTFYIKVDEKLEWLMKIGQYPAWEIEGEPNLERLLGKHAEYYRRGLICESQSYGIGAFGYYRRILEEIIDELLREVSSLLSGEELKKYEGALIQVGKTRVAQEKIELVKDLLPSILRPDGVNPLALLHETLSEGLHAESDEVCLEKAETCRNILVFLTNQLATSRESSTIFKDSMKRLLEKKSKK